MGNIIDHIYDFWKIKDSPNVLFLRYEDVKADLRKTVQITAKFLEKKVPESDIDELLAHLSFDNMKNNPSCNFQQIFVEKNCGKGDTRNCGSLMRRGNIGDWKNYFTPELTEKFDAVICRKEKEMGIQF